MSAPMGYEEVREAFRRLDPHARELLGKSVLDCDRDDLLELSRRFDEVAVSMTAKRDQATAALRDILARGGPDA